MAKEVEPSKIKDDAKLFERLSNEIWLDIEHSNAWRVQAKADFGFVVDSPNDGQWAASDKAFLQDERRPPVVFNQTLKFVRAVCGLEVNNRQSTIFLPSDLTAEGEVKANEMLSAGSDWMDAGCYAPRKKSRAFRDMVICGMGWGESLMEFDDDPKGKYDLERPSPLEMVWDRDARDQNLSDAKRIARVRRMSVDAARGLIPGVTDDEDLSIDDLDASWAADVSAPNPQGLKSKEQKELRQESSSGDNGRRMVHIVQVQWWEYETYYRIPNPQAAMAAQHGMQAGEITTDISEQEFKELKRRAKGKPIPHAALRRRVFKQAFLGSKVLGGVKPCPRKNGFTLHCMTGEPDDNTGTWFGLTRLARDPQLWQNKFFAQLMHMINTTAKGGVLFETDAVPNAESFKTSYAKPQAATEVSPGAISKGKIMAKPGQAVTAGVMQLWQMADQALPSTLGINLELLGLQDRDQAGILEAQRKQAAMTILATLFDSLSMWEQERGRTKLYFLQTIVPDGVFLRIQGEEGFKAIKFLREETLGKYDVIVDDAPTSTNMKDKAWASLQMLLPAIKDMLTPKVVVTLLDYVPNLPSKLVGMLKKIASEPDPGAEMRQKMEIDAQSATTAKDKSAAILNMAKAMSEQIQAQMMQFQQVMNNALAKVGIQSMQPTDPEQAVLGPSGAPEVRQLPALPEQQPVEAAPDPTMPASNGLALPGGLMTNGAMS
jgi:hypothetical protein